MTDTPPERPPRTEIDNQCEWITERPDPVTAGLVIRERCRRTAMAGSKYCWQHGKMEAPDAA